MSSGNDPLVVEDWSAYEKSMLDVLREERRTRLQAAIERPMTPEDLRGFVQGKRIEPEPVDAALLPAPCDLPEEKNEQVPTAAATEKAAHGNTLASSVLASSLEQHAEAVQPCAAPEEAAPLSGGEQEPASVLSRERPDESAPHSAPMGITQNDAPPAARPVQYAQPAPDTESSWWRIPLLLSALAVAAVGAAVAIVKPDRQPVSIPVAPAQDRQVEKNGGAAVGPIQERTNDAATTGYEILADRIRLRGAPGADAPVVQVLRRGVPVTLVERSTGDEWCRVQGRAGREGWMKCEFLKALRPER